MDNLKRANRSSNSNRRRGANLLVGVKLEKRKEGEVWTVGQTKFRQIIAF